MMNKIKKVCIFGMGMMGTSLSYSLRFHPNFRGKIIGIVKSPKSKEWIEKQGLADKVFLSEENFLSELLNSDFLIIGLPVLNAIELIQQLVQWEYEGIITDMCSTHYELEKTVRHLEKSFSLRFVGSHPICGSEVSGPEGFVKDLFKNKLCIIINKLNQNDNEDRNKEDLEFIKNFWKEIGMSILILDAQSHDYLLSYLSHTPHILSSLLATNIGKKEFILNKNLESDVPILGGGLKDMLRIAGSNPKMWYDIIKTNKKNILLALEDFKKELEVFIHHLHQNNFEEFWFNWQNQSKEYRDKLYGKK